ncbi:hypothetical protein CNY89_08045 [Amaricoccus sp. HAR-UPW-R2A-40]|nr:hypothetical protein CNY89_08045 [Amaricoccus sp. HAR-UPW-R2A-40]
MTRWRHPALVLSLFLGMAVSAGAQETCLRPIQPEEIQPPRDDPEFRAFLNQEYQAYLLGMQDYLNCLGREHDSARKETSEVMSRWALWFGDDAVIRQHQNPSSPE